MLLKNKWQSNRFKQLKEEEKRKKSTKALPAEEVQTLGSASDSDEGLGEEAKDKVDFKFLWLHIG